MITKIRKLFYLLSHPILSKTLLSLAYLGYLKDTGWINSFIQKKSLDVNSNPIPWVTYPFIDFIKDRLNKKMTVFEYGSGYSSLFFAPRVSTVATVEHDKEWHLKIKEMLPQNVSLHYIDLEYDGKYSKFINTLGTKFDIIIVDGRDRVNCIKNSVDNLSEKGIIVLDNSEREEYMPGVGLLIDCGFKRLDFWGIAPGYTHKTCTTLFYKKDNCLDI